MKSAKEVLGIVPDKMPGAENDSADKIALGKKLYFEKRLSKDDSISATVAIILKIMAMELIISNFQLV